jgi:hypothetical protein
VTLIRISGKTGGIDAAHYIPCTLAVNHTVYTSRQINQLRDPMTELDSHLHTRISRFCEIGDTLAEDGKYSDAVVSYQYAWNLLPDPKENWEAAT